VTLPEGASPAALQARAGAQPPPEKGGKLGTEVGAAMAKTRWKVKANS